MRKLFFWGCLLSLLPAFANAKTITCSSADSSTQIRIAYGPNGEPPPGIEVRRDGYFKDFLVVRSPALQAYALPSNGSVGGWTYKGQFDYDGKNYLFVMTAATKNSDGSAESASWYFSNDQFTEFTVLNCK